MRFLLALFCAAGLSSLGVVAGTAWTIDDVVLVETAKSWTFTPDGTAAIWIEDRVATVEEEEKRVTNLWTARVEAGEPRQLTRGSDQISSPLVAPDGRHVAFLSDRKPPAAASKSEVAETQLWLLPLSGGEAFPLTRYEREVKWFGWIDGGSLVFAAEESSSLWERQRKERKDGSVVVEDAEHQPPVRLFRVSVPDGKIERLTRDEDWIDALVVSPDGKLAFVRAQQSLSYEFDERIPPHSYVVDLRSGKRTRLFEDGRLIPSDVRWAPDSSGFFLVNAFTRHPLYRQATVAQLWFHSLADGKTTEVTADWDRSVSEYAPVPGGAIALLSEGVLRRPVRYERTAGGWRREELAGRHVPYLDAIAVSPDGRSIVYRHSRATVPGQWFGARLRGTTIGDERRLTALNERYTGKSTGRVEVVRWNGARDEKVEGLLHYPLGWQEGKRYPLVLDIHGGPTGVDRDTWDMRWASPYMLWRQRGAFVFQVNYHGSTGYGIDWVESIGEGRYYDLELPDIERGVDDLIRRGLVDPERLGTTGWSNGGILSAALITASDRYQAASVGAADVEWISDWANVDFGAAFDNYYLGGPPWEIPDVYIEKSPFFRLTRVTTPTIVFTGTEDRNVPPHQSWSLFRAMQQIGKAPTRLVLFPGEPHGLRKIAHQRRKLEEEVAWFERYLFRDEKPVDPAIKPGSPLDGLLVRKDAAAVDGSYGVDRDGALVPETVPFRGLQVGRFEVTRAQYAEFDASVAAAPPLANLPITGVSFERAVAYVGWLRERTGRPFRLPSEGEARKWAEAAGSAGNTLERWAGYAPNPDDRRRILDLLEPLGPGVLLRPVGSFGAIVETGLFDLDGNAAEWAVSEDGSGVVVGPSADLPTSAVGGERAAVSYTGFRVVIGATSPR